MEGHGLRFTLPGKALPGGLETHLLGDSHYVKLTVEVNCHAES